MTIGEAIQIAVTAVAKDWTTVQRKTLRDRARGLRALERWEKGQHKHDSIKDLAYRFMAEAYAKASGGGTYSATARQVMYAARPLILAATDRPLGKEFDVYFTQQLLPGFQVAYPERTATWDVIYDARGHLHEPHTNRELALGTLDVRDYLLTARAPASPDDLSFDPLRLPFPTTGPRGRYTTVLFIEKEGFLPLLQQAQIGDRFDLAIMSTKGMASTAARALMEGLSSACGVRFLVLHDFDKAGFSICATLTQDTERYRFTDPPQVIDLGLRLADVEAEGLAGEPCTYHEREPRENLAQNGATDDEIAFLVDDDGTGQRVELNAFTSDQFLDWLERKLVAADVEKHIPDDATLTAAYQRAVYLHAMNRALAAAHQDAKALALATSPPDNLREAVQEQLDENDTLPWDAAVADIAEDAGT
jgi:hypothetical protein